MSDYQFYKTDVNIEKLIIQILKCKSISPDVEYVTLHSEYLLVHFESEIDSEEFGVLSGIVYNHNNNGFGIKKYCIKEYNNGMISKETWYDTDNGDGTYSGLVETTDYVYSNNILLSSKVTSYWLDGSVCDEEETKYYRTPDLKTISKVSMI